MHAFRDRYQDDLPPGRPLLQYTLAHALSWGESSTWSVRVRRVDAPQFSALLAYHLSACETGSATCSSAQPLLMITAPSTRHQWISSADDVGVVYFQVCPQVNRQVSPSEPAPPLPLAITCIKGKSHKQSKTPNRLKTPKAITPWSMIDCILSVPYGIFIVVSSLFVMHGLGKTSRKWECPPY